jgi:peptide/nickel transport system substrate-binding protein
MKKVLFVFLTLCLCASLFIGCNKADEGDAAGGAASTAMIPGANVPRNQTVIMENPQGQMTPADNLNRWAPGNATFSTGLQQLAMDTLWYIDPDAGYAGVWENALASEPPIYNADFTEMTVKLRTGIFWNDGVEFTADDLIYTVETQMKTPGLEYNGQFNEFIARIEKVDPTTVKFVFTKTNSRFHAFFTVRWSACFIMPKHIFEKQADVIAYKNIPVVGLGPYKLHSFDPQGNWYLWEKREDWQRTSLGRLGSLADAPKYAMYINAGSPDVKVMTQQQHQLDVIHDISIEGVMALQRSNEYTKTWFPGFPWGHPDPTLPAVILNHEKPGLDNKDVRWALALAIDMTNLAITSHRGAMTIAALAVPPTGMYPQLYYQPMESYLNDFTLDLGDGTTFKPYNPNAAVEIATEARKSLGDMVPSDPADIKRFMGAGWWKNDLAAAEKLMLKAGMKRNAAGMWTLPNGAPFQINVLSVDDLEPGQNRVAAAVVESWREFGIEANQEIAVDRFFTARQGTYDAGILWNVETWGGHPDLFFFLGTFHSSLYAPSGTLTNGRNSGRWRNPKLDTIIEGIEKIGFDDPKGLELGMEYVKLSLEEMQQIPLMSFNVQTVMDEYYWTGYPSIDDPYANPVPNWANSRYVYLKLKSTGR